jgi:hypothetical protein
MPSTYIRRKIIKDNMMKLIMIFLFLVIIGNLRCISLIQAHQSPKNSSIRFNSNLGDVYANSFVTELSFWYIFGENALGPPDDLFALIYQDYGNGYLTLDMGSHEEIIDGNGPDFSIVARGGKYTIRVGNYSSSLFTILGTGEGNESFDLSTVDFSDARYVQIEYFSGETIELDAIVATNYNQPTSLENSIPETTTPPTRTIFPTTTILPTTTISETTSEIITTISTEPESPFSFSSTEDFSRLTTSDFSLFSVFVVIITTLIVRKHKIKGQNQIS